MALIERHAGKPNMSAWINELYDHMNQTCLVLIDRSMWFERLHDAVRADGFASVVRRNRRLAGKQSEFAEPVRFAFSYAQRVFLCSAMEWCLMHQFINSVALLEQLSPSGLRELRALHQTLKKKFKIRSWDEWTKLPRPVRHEQLRQLSFSRLATAEELFADIYGKNCLLSALGRDYRDRLAEQYEQYQTLRNGILHRGGETASGAKIEASEADLRSAFEDARLFRDGILRLSAWCRERWLARVAEGSGGAPLLH